MMIRKPENPEIMRHYAARSVSLAERVQCHKLFTSGRRRESFQDDASASELRMSETNHPGNCIAVE